MMKYYIWGAGYCGSLALHYLGRDAVICFVDSYKYNSTYEGIDVISYEEMIKRCQASKEVSVCIASDEYYKEMEERICGENIDYFTFFPSDLYENKTRDAHEALSRFKNIHCGERVFLIGNGPSLSPKDLDVLYANKEICFGFNRIYSIFGKTAWRPKYYGFTDYMSYVTNAAALKEMEATCFIWDFFCVLEAMKAEHIYPFKLIRKSFFPLEPSFSLDITKGTYLGNTVLYDIGFQFAVYMGAREIILLGVDHNYEGRIAASQNHFEGYFSEKEQNMNFTPFQFEKVEKSYSMAEKMCSQRGISIYNASRKSKLKQFTRIQFEELF